MREKLRNGNSQAFYLFAYSPKNPVFDKPTVLHFSVFSGGGKQVSSQNLLTGKYLKNLMATVVIISSTGYERTFKFNHLQTTNGTFSVKYLFPDSGFYQVITYKFKQSSVNFARLVQCYCYPRDRLLEYYYYTARYNICISCWCNVFRKNQA
jgi:hypothetical protein